jgi:hypothetical protein
METVVDLKTLPRNVQETLDMGLEQVARDFHAIDGY